VKRKSRKRAGGSSGRGDEVDPNLTYPIIINAQMQPIINATLNPAPPNFIKDFLPMISASITAVAVVIIGSHLAYIWTGKAEKQKRQYELKKEAYFSALTAIIDIRRRWEDLRKVKLQHNTQNDLLDNHTAHDNAQLERKFDELTNQLMLHQMKMKIVASGEINIIFDQILSKAKKIEDFEVYMDAVFNHLVPAIKADLLQTELQAQKPWWRFWK